MPTPQLIELTEYQPAYFPAEAIPPAVGQALWEGYHSQIEVQEPSFKTKQQWRLTAQGWVGHIPLSPEFRVILKPKIELGNLFRMWEYAYQLNSFHLFDGLIECQSLPEFYERLAHVLALRILERGRKGFYRAYLAQAEPLPYLRGRLEMQPAAQRPGQTKLLCHYEEHTADIADNQILAWTLWHIARSGLCTERTLPAIRRAYQALQGLVTPVAYGPQACVGRAYHRLNEDYRPLHALCRFFLDQSGPGHALGERSMLPFLVDMAHLYELFVAEWLKANLPPHLEIKAQERIDLSSTDSLHFQIDLSLYENSSAVPRCILDTKYKAGPPTAADIAQVIAYAKVKRSREAILIYPGPLPQPLEKTIDDLRLRSLTFALDGNLEEAGKAFLDKLL
jgi:5-methylcytosine-specific restriction enzyme subunit McrC